MFFLKKKARWDSADANERLTAVQQAHDEALLGRLPDFARSDPAPAVRAAAVRRLADLSLLSDRARLDTDPQVRTQARERYHALLADPQVPLPERMRILQVEEDGETLCHVAAHAPESALRERALERVTRASFIAERCQHDPDPRIRLALLSRISDTAALRRLAEATRKSDKQVAHAARARIESLLLAAGDPQALQKQALSLAEAVDRLRRERPQTLHAEHARLQAQWQALAARVPEDVRRRVDGHFMALDMALHPPPPSATPPEAAVAPPQPAPQEPQSAPPPDPIREADAIARAAQRAHMAQLKQGLERLELALNQGQVRAAHQEWDLLQALRGQGAADWPATLRQRLDGAHAALQKLARWQLWSHRKLRRELCAQAEALSGRSLHPDAVSLKVRELQAEWAALDNLEPPSNANRDAAQAWTRRFRALCHQALAPARAYFEKRHSLRSQRQAEIEQLLSQAEPNVAVPAQQAQLRKKLVAQLHALDTVEPKQRAALGRKLRAALTRLDNDRQQREQSVEAEKRKLLANLRRALAHATLEQALAHCAQALAQWQAMPRAARDTEVALRSELDALRTPWQTQADAARAAEAEQQAAQREGFALLLNELEALANTDGLAPTQLEQRIAALRARARSLWQAEATTAPLHARNAAGKPNARGPRRPDAFAQQEHVFEQAVQRVMQAQRNRLAERNRLEAERRQSAASLCAALESISLARAGLDAAPSEDADALLARWQTLQLPQTGAPELEARLARARQWLDTPPAAETLRQLMQEATQQAQQLAIRAECLAGVDSPPEWQRARNAFQIERLAQRFQAAGTSSPDLDAQRIERSWSLLGPIPANQREALAGRILQAVQRLP